VAALLWDGHLPDPLRRTALQNALGAARLSAFERIPTLGEALHQADGMAALRASLAQLPSEGMTDEGPQLAGAAAVFAAAWSRVRAGQPAVRPDPALPHAADYLRMVRGSMPSADAISALSKYLVTVADHGMNASTFTARVVASTGSDAVSAVVAAVGALKGPLHGGAPGPVLDMLDVIGTKERAEAWLEGELLAKRRIMGMGHRVYRVRDPRAAVLEAAVASLEKAVGTTGRLSLARAIEGAATRLLAERHPTRALRANVEFYTAILLDALAIPRTLFSPTFAVGRVFGWYAHIEEQRKVGRLIRPSSRYVGPEPQGAA
jgi:citrate synthase